MTAGLSAQRLIEEATRAAAVGSQDRAIQLLKDAVDAEPRNPAALNMLANRLVAANDPDSAVDLLKRAIAIDPKAPELWLNLAAAHFARGAASDEEEALDSALALEPYLFQALLQKGELYERQGREAECLGAYSAALTITSRMSGIPPALQARLRHAGETTSRLRQQLADRISAAAQETGETSSRFDYCLDIIAGRQRNFLPQPTRLYFPGLPAVSFFDRDLFPWFADLERATDAIREELLAVMAANSGMRPYIDIDAGAPVNQWDKLNRSLDWSAFFLWENGKRNDAACAACPRTAAVLESLPLYDVPGNAPTAMFSILKGGAHIPPHHGETNIRAVVHLPLVVPAGCSFRVGPDERPWIEGQAWGFDDTLEHEAWNRSTQARAILIVDAWNPYLTNPERTLLSAAERVMKSSSKL